MKITDEMVLAALNARDLKERQLNGYSDHTPARTLDDWSESIEPMRAALEAALEGTLPTQDERVREVACKIARLGAEHMPILALSGGAVPEPMGEVCSQCGDNPCTFDAELDAILPALSRAAVSELETEWEYAYAEQYGEELYAYGDTDDEWFKSFESAYAARVEETDFVVSRRKHTAWERVPEREADAKG